MKSGERPVAVVTGASQGVGRSVAERTARSGWHVIALARRADVLAEVVRGIEAGGGSAEPAAVDVRDAEALDGVIRSAAARHGRLDGLVNNAARYVGGRILDTDLETFKKNFHLNVDATYVAMRAAMRVMSEQGGGSIVNIGSVTGLRASPGTAGYGASKAALVQMSAVAAMEVGEFGVRVNCVTPGTTWTPSFEQTIEGKSAEEIRAMEVSGTILGRFGQPMEVADAVNFLLSDQARFITGVNLRVDGGAYWFRGGNRLIGRR